MEIISEIVSKNNGNEYKEMFQKIDRAIFCTICGSQFNEESIDIVADDCPLCGGHIFLKDEFAEILAGYLELNKKGLLKKYYQSRFKKSVVRMNTKRMIIWLLHKDKLLNVDDKNMEDIVRRTLWKRF